VWSRTVTDQINPNQFSSALLGAGLGPLHATADIQWQFG
jgi:hypothetical protein